MNKCCGKVAFIISSRNCLWCIA